MKEMKKLILKDKILNKLENIKVWIDMEQEKFKNALKKNKIESSENVEILHEESNTRIISEHKGSNTTIISEHMKIVNGNN